MATTYIDVNAANSSVIDTENNNRWVYRVNDGLDLPTGTQIQVASSFINKKGITGGSIEIPEDIEETMYYSYYGVDTDYKTLIQHPQDPAHSYNFDLFINYNNPVNDGYAGRIWANDRNEDGTETFSTKYMPIRNQVGGSETKMPFVNFYKTSDGTVQLLPMIGVLSLRVPKGVYSVLQLANLIQDQMNGIIDGNDIGSQKTFVERQKEEAVPAWQGIPVTNVMNRLVQSEEPFINPLDGKYQNPSFPKEPSGPFTAVPFWTAMYENNNAVPGTGIDFLSAKFTDQLKFRGQIDGAHPVSGDGSMKQISEALGRNQFTPYSAIMIQPQHFENIRRGYIETQPDDFVQGNIDCSVNQLKLENFGQSNSAEKMFFQGFSSIRNTLEAQVSSTVHFNTPPGAIVQRNIQPTAVFFTTLAPTLYSTEKMNYFTTGIPIGTTAVEMSYDTDNAGFSISQLHESRKFPTHDRFGTSQSANAGQAGVFIKRVCKGNFQNVEASSKNYNQPGGVAIPDTSAGAEAFLTAGGIGFNGQGIEASILRNTLENIMSRLSGVAIFNWAATTARKFKTKQFSNQTTDTMRHFDEFFNSETEAKAAWTKTLWSRLGFTYEQIQDPSNWVNEPSYYGVSGTNKPPGFTTNQQLDSSVITSISTLFNSFNAAAPAAAPANQGTPSAVLKDVGIQLYNMLDVNVPSFPFNNNSHTAGSTCFPTNFAAYQNSFYNGAVMTPVVTQPRPIVANQLPTLSEHGYYLISSSIVGEQDIVKRADPLPILDVVPISSLSNQDFIADRTEIIHTITNPKVLNQIDISILNPDLTAPKLEKNSAIILKITKPLPAPTNMIANVINEQSGQLVQQQVIAREQAEQKAVAESQKGGGEEMKKK